MGLCLSVALAAGCSGGRDGRDDDGRDDGGPSRPTTSSSGQARGGTPTGDLEVLEVEGRPSAVATAADAVWVTSDHEPQLGPVAGSVRRYDPGTGAVTASASVPSPPVAVVPVDEGAWLIGATGRVARVEVDPGGGRGARVVAEADLGGALVDGALHAGRLYVGDIEAGVVHVLDAASGAAASPPIPVSAGVVRLAVAGERLWVSGLEQELTPIDLGTGRAGPPVPVGAAPIGMAVAGGGLWVAESDDESVGRLDAGTGAPVGDPIAVGRAPIALAADGGVLWVLNQDDPSVQALDARTGGVLGAPVPLPMRPRGLAVGEAGVWVAGVDPSRLVLVPRTPRP